MLDADRITALEAKIARLEALIEQQVEPDTEPDPETGPVESIVPFEPQSSRRKLLRNVAIATGGAAVGLLATSATPAAAVDDPYMFLGSGPNNTPGSYRNQSFAATHIRWVGGLIPDATAFIFEAGMALNVNSLSVYPAALGGWTTNPEKPHGITGYTTVTGGNGVIGQGHLQTGTGVLGLGGNGVVGISSSSTGDNGYGVTGVSSVGPGVGGRGISYGLESSQSNRAALLLKADEYVGGGYRAAPPFRTDFHLNGEIDIDVNGDIWACVYPGVPGVWRKLVGPTTAGAFQALSPGRVYDSRVANPSPGVLSNLENRTVSVANRRDLATGDVVQTDFVALGATAISCNVGVVETQRSGYLTINPGGNTTVNSASINWSASNLILNNGVILTLNAVRELTVICGGGGATHFVIDVTGFFR